MKGLHSAFEGEPLLSSEERRKKEKENRKNSILKAARKLFFERGFKSGIVDLIAAKAGELGPITFTSTARKKFTQILISANIDRGMDVPNGREPLQALIALPMNTWLLSDNNELFRILMTFMLQAENMNLTDEQNTQLIHTTNENVHVIAEILQRGVESGEFIAGMDVRRMQFAIWGLLNGVISLYIYTGAPERRGERIFTIVHDSLNALLKGIKS